MFDVCCEDMVNRHYVWCSMVSSVKWDNVQIEAHGCIKIIIINFMCLGEVRWGRSSLREKDPNFILGQTYVSSDESSRKCLKACEAGGETPKIRD